MLTIVDRVEPSPGEDSRPSLVSIHFYVARRCCHRYPRHQPVSGRWLGPSRDRLGLYIVSWLAAWLLVSVLGNPASC